MFLHPLADAGTPLMWAGILHLLFGNFIIGIAEGLLLAWIFKISRLRAILYMIPANYFSMIVGALLFNSIFAARFTQWFLGDTPLYLVENLLIVAAFFSYLLTILLEWPFVAAAMSKSHHGVGRTLLASFVVQTASYAVLASLYGNVTSISLFRQTSFATAHDVIKTPSAGIYFVDSRDQCVYLLPLDGSPRRAVDTDSVADETRWLFLGPSPDGKNLDLCVAETGNSTDPHTVILPAIMPLPPEPAKVSPSWSLAGIGPALDLRPPGDYPWQVRTGFWPNEGLYATNSATLQHIHLALETPFFSWTARNATILPNDQVVYSAWGQILLLDLPTQRITLLALGYTPFVVLPPEPSNASTKP